MSSKDRVTKIGGNLSDEEKARNREEFIKMWLTEYDIPLRKRKRKK